MTEFAYTPSELNRQSPGGSSEEPLQKADLSLVEGLVEDPQEQPAEAANLAILLGTALEKGEVNARDLAQLLDENELDDAKKAEVYAKLEENGIEIISIDVPTDIDAIETEQPRQMPQEAIDVFRQEIQRYPLLSAAEEVELSKRIENGDLEAKELMINSNLRLVFSIANNYQGHDFGMDDLVMEGIIGLNRAAEKFDWRLGFKFSTYATWWIRQAVQRAVYDKSRNIRLPVHVQEMLAKMRRSERNLWQEHKRDPTIEEIAEDSGVPLDKAIAAWRVQARTISLNSPATSQDGSSEIGDLQADDHAILPDEAAEAEIRKAAIRKAVEELPLQEKKVITLRFGLGDNAPMTLEEIGKQLGLTRERIRQIEADAFGRLRALEETQGLGGQ